MRAIYYLTATGQIIDIMSYEDGTSSTIIDDRVGAGMAYAIDDTATIENHYYPAGVKTLRPVLLEDPDVIVAADGVINVDFALPNGTTVDSPTTDTDFVAAGSEHFQFKTARLGEWEFQFGPPFPCKPMTLRIVANAF